MYDDYNTILNHQWIPKEAFLYFPTGDSAKRQEDDFKLILPNNELKRLIYEGDVEYLPEEYELIEKFRTYLTQKEVFLGKQWSKAYVYKFLQSTGYDYKKSMKEIIAHDLYKEQLRKKDFQQLRRQAEPVLAQGLFYFNGRDAKYRPIIVFDIARIHSKKLTESELFNCLQYFFEFLYRNMLINGQVENVVGIIDVGLTSPMDLLKPMKMTIGFLQGNYKYKLHAVYIVRSTSMFQMAYGLAKHLMKEDTIRKINIIEKGSQIPQLLEYCNPMQLEQKFGGTHPNLEVGECWPPKQFGDDYSNPKVQRKMVTVPEYKELYDEGLLPARKIYRDFVTDGSNESDQTPLMNSGRVSVKMFKESSVKNHRREKSIFEKILEKLTCRSCFRDKSQIHRTSSKTVENHF